MTVTINSDAVATVEITDTSKVTVVDTTRDVVEVVIAGPQGIQGPQGVAGSDRPLGDLPDVDTTGAVDKSVLFYDAEAQQWVGNDVNTIVALTDGGGF